MEIGEARRRATELLAAIRRDEAPALPEERLFEAVAEEVFHRYGQQWKPERARLTGTICATRSCPGSPG